MTLQKLIENRRTTFVSSLALKYKIEVFYNGGILGETNKTFDIIHFKNGKVCAESVSIPEKDILQKLQKTLNSYKRDGINLGLLYNDCGQWKLLKNPIISADYLAV